MPRYKGKCTSDVTVKFDKFDDLQVEFVSIREDELRSLSESVWLERRQAIRVAKAILRKYAPEALK